MKQNKKQIAIGHEKNKRGENEDISLQKMPTKQRKTVRELSSILTSKQQCQR